MTSIFLALVFVMTMIPAAVQVHAQDTAEPTEYDTQELIMVSKQISKMADTANLKFHLHPSASSLYSTARLIVNTGGEEFDFSAFQPVDIMQDMDDI